MRRETVLFETPPDAQDGVEVGEVEAAERVLVLISYRDASEFDPGPFDFVATENNEEVTEFLTISLAVPPSLIREDVGITP